MIALLDVDVLLALAWPHHIHHRAAHQWMRNQQQRGWATCPVTESGFVRVSSNPKANSEAKTPAQAIELLRRIVGVTGHRFWNDDVAISSSVEFSGLNLVGHRQVTDAHLLSLSRRRGGLLATFDRGVSRLLPVGVPPETVVALVPVDPG